MKNCLLLGIGLVLLLNVTTCGSNNSDLARANGKTMAQCPSPDTVQCGYGCIAATITCCNSKQYSTEWDIGTFECPGTTIAQCVSNTTGSCGTSQYCCSTNGSFNSVDCKDGTVVCNQNCVPVGSKCCSMTDPTNCGTVGGVKPPSGGTDCTVFTALKCCPEGSGFGCSIDTSYVQTCGCPAGTTNGGANPQYPETITDCICL